MWCLIACVLTGGSAGLAWIAPSGTLGRALIGLVVAAALMALCWRLFERVLWLRFPTQVEHTVAWRYAALGLVPLVLAQAVLVALGV